MSERGPESSDATWAHNRWPTIGLYTGAGLAVVFGILLGVGWMWTIVGVVGLALLGCFGGVRGDTFALRLTIPFCILRGDGATRGLFCP